MTHLGQGTIEQPHALINLRVGKKSVVAPYVSLAVRVPQILPQLRQPGSLGAFRGCYSETRSL
eukprot:4582252-Alexandrium_andersonii.AAC.1